MLLWHIPTFHGDISLKALSPHRTLVQATDLTPSETEAMKSLRKKALNPGWFSKPWAGPEAFLPLVDDSYRTSAGREITLEAPIDQVQAILSKALKPGRKLLSVVRFTNGKMEETEGPYRTPALPQLPAPEAITPQGVEPAHLVAEPQKPMVGVTVAKPVLGCPAPDFEDADIMANRVLEKFLDSDQIADFRKYNSFVSIGQDTGHRYAVTSREARGRLASFRRSLYDLTERNPYCVHDWTVPAAEEMLALHLLLSVPGGESYLRRVPDLGQE